MCVFCRIANHELPSDIVMETPRVVAFRDANPQAPTHVLVIPRKHIRSLADIEDEDAGLLGEMVVVATAVARDAGLVDGGYRVVINTGVRAGQSVFHLHVHVLGGRAMSWPPG